MKDNVLFDDLLKKIPNKYVLTILAGKRVRELAKGETSLVKTKGKTTLVQIALREVLEGKIISDYKDKK